MTYIAEEVSTMIGFHYSNGLIEGRGQGILGTIVVVMVAQLLFGIW